MKTGDSVTDKVFFIISTLEETSVCSFSTLFYLYNVSDTAMHAGINVCILLWC